MVSLHKTRGTNNIIKIMKRILQNTAVLAGITFLFLACSTEYNIFVEPKAEMQLSKTSVDVLEPVYITNLGKGETFAFWPGDEGQDYSKVDESKNAGLPPNRGKDFEYTYLRSGTYTITMVASSFDEEQGKLVKQVSTQQITVNPGNNGNNFTRFAIDNALAGYSPEGIINGNKISIPIGFINRVSGISDKDYAILINKRPPLFSANSSSAKVYSEEGTLLQGRGDDPYQLNLLDANTLEPIIRKFTVVQDGLPNEYSVAALFYPVISNLKVLGNAALEYSQDGLNAASEEETKKLQLAYPEKTFFGVFLVGVTPTQQQSAILDFTLTEGARLYLKSTRQEIISGETPVDISTTPVDFEIVRTTVDGFSISSSFKIYTTVF
jgi:hypothetical protein